MSRPLAGYIGYDAEPTTDAAPGIWTLREAELYKRKAQWPVPFAPDVITGLQLWLDASDASTLYDATTGGSLVAADGGVARWEDKSGNARHATQGTAGSRPLRKASVQNGLDGLRFDGSDDVLSVPSSTATFKFLHSTEATYFFVGKFGSTADPNTVFYLFNTRGTGSTGIEPFYDDRTSSSRNEVIRTFARGSGTNVLSNQSANGFAPANVVGLVSDVIDFSSATAAGRSTLRFNGASPQTNNTDTASVDTGNSSTDLFIGGRSDGSSVLDGDICEVVIYNSALSDTDREAVENYLLAKWGIT